MNFIILFRVRFVFLLVTSTILTYSVQAQPKTVTILHTNDIHASFVPHEAFWIRGNSKPLVGGFNELAFAIDSICRLKPYTILIDDGDVMTGNPITEYIYQGAEGGALFEMMNRIGYDAWTQGNHDFDISVANLRQLTSITKFPTISANILDTLNRFPVNNKEYIILERNGLKIGIIGVISKDFYSLVNQNSQVGIKILPPIETVKRIADQLNPKVDILIALTHQGVEDDSILAMNVRDLDVIVGGHSHTRLRQPKVINGVIIVQAGSNCENLGVLDLTIENKKVNNYTGSLHQLWYNSDRPKTSLSLFIDSIKSKIDQDYAEIIGTLKTDWERGRGGESGIGNFIADAQREKAGADVGFMNSAGIRKDLASGPITKKDLFEILPFRNILTTFELTGRQVRTIVEFYIMQRSSIQTSGIKCEWRKGANGQIEFLSFLINGAPLDENRVYHGAANDYMMGEAKKYLGIDTPRLMYLNKTVLSVVEEKIRSMKEITSSIDQRIKNVQ